MMVKVISNDGAEIGARRQDSRLNSLIQRSYVSCLNWKTRFLKESRVSDKATGSLLLVDSSC
jgi:hypothetical protein